MEAQLKQLSQKADTSEKSVKDIAIKAIESSNKVQVLEKVGIITDSVKVLGSLTKLYIPPSNFDVYPFVGVTYNTPDFKANYEVQKIIEVDLETLMNPETCTYKKIQHRTGNDFVVPCYYVQGEVIWGATAMIISELLEVLKD